jgi:diguanylate cyclase (GGDEF)-like protein
MRLISRSTLVPLATLVSSLVLLWYVDWLLPTVHLGPIAAIPLLVLAYRAGVRVTLLVAVIAAIGFALADVGIGARYQLLDVLIDSATLFAAFGIVTLAGDRWRTHAAQVDALRKSVEREKHRAEHDPVTRLPNRTLFDVRLAETIARAQRSRTAMGILVVDVDRFKQINDRWGHPAGDAVLLEIARRLAAAVRSSDTVARIGGDEFGAIVQPLARIDDVRQLAARVRAEIAAPVSVGPGAIAIAVSVGYAVFPEDGIDLAALIETADRRMYEFKAQSRRLVRPEYYRTL